ncbi:MAG: tRNA pseudouridine(38-40) synthase TruA [Robiginitomaculum sp.]|nr:MAG: tRNA pseudouridine(38-40) synthase TruA [Robiginitomaculum sp.]
MTRFKLTIEYDGTPFSGWQRQDNQPTVQGSLEQAASALEEVPVQVFGAGRTDAGVHALGQVAHVDLAKDLRADTVRDALNHHLGANPISVLDAQQVDDDFEARFDAIRRTYLYRLIDRRPPLALERGRVWRMPQIVDVEAMREAAQVLLGAHDFTTFRDVQCQANTPMRTLDEISISRVGAEIHFFYGARSYLHRQVRSITGSLVNVGVGRWTKVDLKQALQACDRSRCGPVAPADGLYLNSVHY